MDGKALSRGITQTRRLIKATMLGESMCGLAHEAGFRAPAVCRRRPPPRLFLSGYKREGGRGKGARIARFRSAVQASGRLPIHGSLSLARIHRHPPGPACRGQQRSGQSPREHITFKLLLLTRKRVRNRLRRRTGIHNNTGGLACVHTDGDDSRLAVITRGYTRIHMYGKATTAAAYPLLAAPQSPLQGALSGLPAQRRAGIRDLQADFPPAYQATRPFVPYGGADGPFRTGDPPPRGVSP